MTLSDLQGHLPILNLCSAIPCRAMQQLTVNLEHRMTTTII